MISAVAVWQESVRGGFRAGTSDLPGLERVRALMARGTVQPPLFRLTGIAVVQASPGSAICSVPASALLLDPMQLVDTFMVAEAAATLAGRTGVGSGWDVRCATISFHHQRAVHLDAERLVARGSIVHAGRTYTLVEATVFDALGRPVTRAMASLVGSEARDGDLRDTSEPAWPTPDPWQREFRAPPIMKLDFAHQPSDIKRYSWPAPLLAALGYRPLESSRGRFTSSLPLSRWLLDRPEWFRAASSSD